MSHPTQRKLNVAMTALLALGLVAVGMAALAPDAEAASIGAGAKVKAYCHSPEGALGGECNPEAIVYTVGFEDP